MIFFLSTLTKNMIKIIQIIITID